MISIGGQVDPKHRSIAGKLCDDDDGGLLQPEASGVFREVGNIDLLMPKMARIA
jgi:hypothetical protein